MLKKNTHPLYPAFFYSIAIHTLAISGLGKILFFPEGTRPSIPQSGIAVNLSASRHTNPESSSGKISTPKAISPLPAGPITGTQSADPSDLRADQSPLNVNSLDWSNLRKKIQDHLDYPLSLRRQRIQGIVKVKITLNSQGALEQVLVIQSSGYAELDQLALEAVRRTNPIPLPLDFQATTRNSIDKAPVKFQLSLPIEFTLHSIHSN